MQGEYLISPLEMKIMCPHLGWLIPKCGHLPQPQISAHQPILKSPRQLADSGRKARRLNTRPWPRRPSIHPKTKEEFMRSKLFQVALLIFALTGMVPSILVAAENMGAGGQGSGSDDKKYVGEWVGSYSDGNGNGDKLSYTLSKDEKGQWRGVVKWINQDGEHSADFKSLQIAD